MEGGGTPIYQGARSPIKSSEQRGGVPKAWRFNRKREKSERAAGSDAKKGGSMGKIIKVSGRRIGKKRRENRRLARKRGPDKTARAQLGAT